MSNEFSMELCGNQNAWRIVPDIEGTFSLERTGECIEADGFEVEVRNRLCWTFTGQCDMTLYPSGQLLIKTTDKALAEELAQRHLSTWVQQDS